MVSIHSTDTLCIGLEPGWQPHHVHAAPVSDNNFDATTALLPTRLYSKADFFNEQKLTIGLILSLSSDFLCFQM
jgi:hypothetical protein